MSTVVLDSRIKLITAPKIVGLPEGLFLEYFGFSNDLRITFAIIRPRVDLNHTDWVLLASGCKDELYIYKIYKIDRCCDSGITTIDTELGQFIFPTLFNPELKPTLNKKGVILYDS